MLARTTAFLVALSSSVICAAQTQEDRVEFLNGSQLTGRVIEIRQADKEFDFESRVGTRQLRQTYRFEDVHAVSLGGKRHVLTPRTERSSADAASQRTAEEVRGIIEDAGKRPPDWYAATKVNTPDTLDLSWPAKPEGKWNNKKNVGQYIWDIVNPNPSRWHSGVKLVTEIKDRHQGQASLLNRDQRKLGRMYFELLQDYPRAAYWMEQAGVSGRELEGVILAECYWRLGNKPLAMKTLTQPTLPFSAIKLLAAMGELDTALRLAKAFEGSRVENDARILAADALRRANRLPEAIEVYEQVLESDSYRNPDYEKRFKGRAQDSITAIELFDQADVRRVADGKYADQSVGYNGPIEVQVHVAEGKIIKVEVIRHREKQFYSALEDTPRQIIARQSVQDIDGFSGATITANAIVNATAKALAKGGR